MLFELRMRRRKKKTWRHTDRRGNGWRVRGGEFSSGSHSGWEMIFKTGFVPSLKNRTESKIASVPTNPASSLESGKFFTVHLLSDSSVLLLFLFPTIPGSPCPAACTRHLEHSRVNPVLCSTHRPLLPSDWFPCWPWALCTLVHLHTSAPSVSTTPLWKVSLLVPFSQSVYLFGHLTSS